MKVFVNVREKVFLSVLPVTVMCPPHRGIADRPVQDRVPEAAEEGVSPGEAGGGEQQRVPRRVPIEEEGFGSLR